MSENIYDWMAKQKFPLDRAGVEKVSTAKLAELREAGIKFVKVLPSPNPPQFCEACLLMAVVRIEIEFAQPLPLPGCDKKPCGCIYIAVE